MKKLKIELEGDLLQYFITECQIDVTQDKIDIRDEIIGFIKTQVVAEDIKFAKELYFDREFDPSDLMTTRTMFREYNEYLFEQKEKYPTLFESVDILKVIV